MKIIAIEEHYNNSGIGKASREAFAKVAPNFREAFASGMDYSPKPGTLSDIGASRIADMDKHGIDMQVLSANSSQMLKPEEAVFITREANDQLAAAIKQNPTRFAGFAALPTTDPVAAAVELERSVVKLGLKGATIYGRTNEKFIDDLYFEPILAAAEALNVPLYLHPGVVPVGLQELSYNGFDPIISTRLASCGWGWHADAGLQVLRMILSGVFDRHPSLQVITGHWGEMLPFLLERIDVTFYPEITKLEKTVSEYVKSNVHITPSGMLSNAHLKLCMEIIGIDRIMFSADYPFIGNEGARDFIEKAPIAEADKEKFAYKNAKTLLKL